MNIKASKPKKATKKKKTTTTLLLLLKREKGRVKDNLDYCAHK